MAKWIFRKPEPTNVRGLCVVCETAKQKKVSGKDKYKALCGSCETKLYQTKQSSAKEKERRNKETILRQKPYRQFKGPLCEKCGFVPEHKCQLDVDHIDGDKKNNDLSNLQTLCANCHRLKTQLQKDYLNNRYK